MGKQKTETTKTVLLAGLGLCEHCGTLLTIEDMPGDSIDAIWKCPKCEGVLSEKSFGYEKGKKVLWVGKDGKWANHIPNAPPFDEFVLGTWKVRIKPPPLMPYF
jgi:hypothetical protein